MEERIDQADQLIGVFSDEYSEAIFSRSERWAAYWDDPEGRVGFLIPVEVVKVTKWPRLVSPLNRCSLIGLSETAAIERLRTFLEPRKPPIEKPAYPGSAPSELSSTAFTQDSEPLGVKPPNFPAADTIETKSADAGTPYPSPTLDPNLSIRCIDDHEPKPQIFGRDDEVETIVSSLLDGKMILVAGGPGMGKTAVTTVAFYDPRIVARFGRRRVFASLETATEARAILAKLVETLGLPPTGDEVSLLRILETTAAEEPFAAILDNAETVLDADRSAAERLLKLAAQIQGLSLAVTIRGVAPSIPSAVQIEDLSKLDPDAARDAFVEVAGTSFKGDPDLPHLLHALDGHALSIHLVAAQAIGSPSLAGLRESWDEAHAEILRMSGEEESRLTSVRASLALSLNNRRMKATPLARRLISLLAFLPAGLAETDVCSLLGKRGAVTKARANDAIICLNQLRLVERRPDRRLRTLTPLRESVKDNVVPLKDDQNRLIERYIKLAERGNTFGRRSWEEYRQDVEAEADNLDSVCELAVKTNIAHRELRHALRGLKEIYVLSGQGGVASISHALDRLRSHPPSAFMADCTRALGDIAQMHRDFEAARIHYDKAILLYRNTGNTTGEADTISRLSMIAIMQSDHSIAQLRIRESLTLGQQVNSKAIIANSTLLLGVIALEEMKLDIASTQFAEALILFQAIDNALGEANSLKRLGEIAQKNGEYATAETRFSEAMVIYHRIGHRFGEALCMNHFGDNARNQGNYEKARALYEDSRIMFRRLGDLVGEAETTIKTGLIQVSTDDPKKGLSSIEAGFALYFKNTSKNNRALPGWSALHRAFTAGDASESQKYRELARLSWTNIGRLDLIADWIGSY
jgi:tetratricopeptide (TPR) repeat protein